MPLLPDVRVSLESGTTQSTLRFLRLVYGIVLFWMILNVILAQRPGPGVRIDLNRTMLVVFAGVSAALAAGIRIRFIRRALEALRLKADDAVPLQRWRKFGIAYAVLCETIVFYGFVLQFMGGGTLSQSVLFYGFGIGMMLLSWPQLP